MYGTFCIVLLIGTFNYRFSCGRVYCQDAHATPWYHHGFSCPVNCHNVVHAVERIKMLDLANLLHVENESTEMVESGSKLKLSGQPSNIITTDLYMICEKVLKNKTIQREVQHHMEPSSSSTICELIHKRAIVKPVLLKLLRKCSRRNLNFDSKFVTVLTNTFNKHTGGKINFTEAMTSRLIKEVLGENFDKLSLRSGGDVTKLLRVLQRGVKAHRVRSRTSSITLKSRHCLSLYVPGCYCVPGFVENSGQCVRPTECFQDKVRSKYLTRVSIL